MTDEQKAAAAARMADVRAARGKNKPAADLTPAQVKALDGDGDGEAGGSLPQVAIKRAKAQRATREAAELAAAQREAKTRGDSPRPDGAGPTGVQRAAAAADNAAVEREAAARAHVAGTTPAGMVRVRVTKQGDGRISTGQHAPGIGEVHYAWREEFTIAADIAQALEDRYFVEPV